MIGVTKAVVCAILNTFYLRLYGVRHMVEDHSDSKREKRDKNTDREQRRDENRERERAKKR